MKLNSEGLMLEVLVVRDQGWRKCVLRKETTMSLWGLVATCCHSDVECSAPAHVFQSLVSSVWHWGGWFLSRHGVYQEHFPVLIG